jgi:peptide/nickel transport system substrate-binding protein
MLALGALSLLALLYYSNQLIEQDLKALRGEVAALKLQGRVVQRPVRKIEGPNLLEENRFDVAALLPDGFVPHGRIRTAQIGRPNHYHPLSNWYEVSQAWHMVVPGLSGLEPGRYDRHTPELALKIEQKGGEFIVHLRDGVYWQPLEPRFLPGVEMAPQFLQRHPVTAHDFKFYVDAIMNPHVEESGAGALRQLMYDLEEVRVIDDLTFAVRWRVHPETGKPRFQAKNMTLALRPLPSWLYQNFADGTPMVDDLEQCRHNSIWAQNFSQHWAKNIVVGCGAWLFDGANDREIRFRRNPDHYDPLAALTEEQVWLYKESGDAVWQEFKAGGIDLFESRSAPEKVLEVPPLLAADPSVEQLDHFWRSYRFIGWNQARPLFRSKGVRQALTMGIDRERIVEQLMHGMGIASTGPGFPFDEEYDSAIEPLSFDLMAARKLLADEGWVDTDGDGIVDKMIDGKRVKFSFSLMYYVKSMFNRLLVDHIATSLREIGVECRPLGLDIADFSATLEGQDFDAVAMAWVTGTPPSDHRQLWHSSGAYKKGSSNRIGFRNAEVDSVLDALDYEDDAAKRLDLYHRFHQVIHEEQPYTFLYVSKAAFLHRNNLHNVFVPKERPDICPDSTVCEPMKDLFYVD